MDTKVFKQGNVIVLQVTGEREQEDHAKDVNVHLATNQDKDYFENETDDFNDYYVIEGKKLGRHVVKITDLKKEDDSGYTQEEFITFYRESTGFNPASGGNGAGGGEPSETVERSIYNSFTDLNQSIASGTPQTLFINFADDSEKQGFTYNRGRIYPTKPGVYSVFSRVTITNDAPSSNVVKLYIQKEFLSNPSNNVDYDAQEFTLFPNVSKSYVLKSKVNITQSDIDNSAAILVRIFGNNYTINECVLFMEDFPSNYNVSLTNAENNESLKLGKARFVSSSYTEASPFVVGTDWLLLPISNVTVQDADFPTLSTWINAAGEIVPDNGNQEDFLARLVFDAKPSVNNANIEFRLDIGDKSDPDPLNHSVIEIDKYGGRMFKGAGEENRYSYKFDYYAGTTFLANNCKIYVRGSNPIDLYDLDLKIIKLRAK